MLITEILARNARVFGDEVALVERDPRAGRRRQLGWPAFDREASRFANALRGRGIRKGDRVVHLLMNCLEWLPAYFGILRSGAWAVPLNFRFEADTIQACAGLAEPRVFLFGEEFVERVGAIRPALDRSVEHYVYLGPGEGCPDFAIAYEDFVRDAASDPPEVPLEQGAHPTGTTPGWLPGSCRRSSGNTAPPVTCTSNSLRYAACQSVCKVKMIRQINLNDLGRQK